MALFGKQQQNGFGQPQQQMFGSNFQMNQPQNTGKFLIQMAFSALCFRDLFLYMSFAVSPSVFLLLHDITQIWWPLFSFITNVKNFPLISDYSIWSMLRLYSLQKQWKHNIIGFSSYCSTLSAYLAFNFVWVIISVMMRNIYIIVAQVVRYWHTIYTNWIVTQVTVELIIV